MKFVDEATINVFGGNGGAGCMSFRRERFVAKGGPDGGDGGDGGSVYLRASDNINTLADFRYTRSFKADVGRPGGGRNCTGRSGDNLYISVPTGTEVYDEDTGELIGDLSKSEQELLVAHGGFHGLGNTRFKSSTNRAPRKISQGSDGDIRTLRLELKLLADVGLLGMPSVGKSSMITAVSDAKPKIADYPFTTLHPNLGVVRVGPLQSFVMADLPGLIAGAAQGQGLGIQFLKHLSRCRLLLHLVDIGDLESNGPPLEQYNTIEKELQSYGESVSNLERWLVCTKSDLLLPEEAEERVQQLVTDLAWDGPLYTVSSSTREGLKQLCLDVITQMNQHEETAEE